MTIFDIYLINELKCLVVCVVTSPPSTSHVLRLYLKPPYG